MGCDIHSFVEVQEGGAWASRGNVFPPEKWMAERGDGPSLHPWTIRSYRLFGFLAGVRNYSGIQPLSAPRGLPAGIADETAAANKYWDTDGHSHSWLTLAELLAVDYDSHIEDRSYTKQVGANSWDGSATAERGQGTVTTLREFLPAQFFQSLEIAKTLGNPENVRFVFWFDN